MDQDYVRTARGKGLSRARAMLKHAMANALLPLVTLAGLDLAGLLSGVVLTETVFNWPGIGRLASEAIFNLDIPVIMGTVLFSAFLIVVANLLVDLLYAWLDPRIRLAERMNLRRFVTHGNVGAAMVTLLVIVAIFAPVLAPHDPTRSSSRRPSAIPARLRAHFRSAPTSSAAMCSRGSSSARASR